MTSIYACAGNLAAAFLSGGWTLADMVQQGRRATDLHPRSLRALARRVLAASQRQSRRFEQDSLKRFFIKDVGFHRAWAILCCDQGRAIREVFWTAPEMNPAPGNPATWDVPAIETTSRLAAWLDIDASRLLWLADCRGLEADVPAGPLRNYTYQWLAKRGGRFRLLEKPKKRLKAIQRKILHGILDRIPPHEAVHGYRRGRSVKTYSEPHVGQSIVVHFDLRDFFPSIPRPRVQALFWTAGYPSSVARVLAGLCTNTVSDEIFLDPRVATRIAEGKLNRDPYRQPHLPQGAPTSPALANLCAYRLDRRLAALARAVDAVYTRYADDLTFSGGERLEPCARRFQVHVCRIALEEGFEINTHKSRFMRRSIRQQIAGVVINTHPNIRRDQYDLLKATLHRCLRDGPAAQNRDGHRDFRAYLRGRIAFVASLNPARGHKLLERFERIRWPYEPRPIFLGVL